MEAMQYELARNMTLLFFFERLLDKGEPRTLHDLSCHTLHFFRWKESTFTINTFQHSDSKDSSGGKDYNTQAVEYFSEKLAQYGEGTEVPIRSLLGHRSQASPEVRHVSGQHFHEFREFLFKHPEAFTIDDEKETVILANFDAVKSHCPPELHFQPDVTIDPQETQTLLDFLAQCIEVKGPILVEQLFQIVSCNLPESMWSNLFNTPTHLTSFLRLFSDSFHIQCNLVTLLQPPKISQKHITAQVSLIKENKTSNEEMKNAKNLANDNNNELIEKVEKVYTKSEKARSPPLDKQERPRLLRQPKLQQKLTDAQAKSLSPEPPMSPVPQMQPEDKNKGVNFRKNR
ncbi:hypothetical protein NQ317_001288 [Molorchus minor]|uniref:Egal-1 winged helix domain-containing protein n=1 Tax=Molorchus minor TaxID=1323400 RepID=A0ABQ9JPE1_9CUCU|nr:hypothetical protein NQ317_001288 [Molorchus minor]